MSERPAIPGTGTIVEEREPGRLYEIAMPNGYRALAVVQRGGPAPPPGDLPENCQVEVRFSPYDMSRSRIVRWLLPA